MKTHLIKYTMILFAAVSFTLAANLAHAQEQAADSLATSAVEARGDAPDENIEVQAGENVLGEEAEAPAIKGGETGERAASRFVNFDNYTGWYISTYIDGYYQGTVAPWGNLKINVPAGRTYRLYGRADFTDGSYKYWGARNRYFGNNFIWRLNP
ncbi:MAG: hypothetical protein ACNA78_11230 [Balneolaceae bacterium]